MKRFVLAITYLLLMANSYAQVLFTYGKNAVTKVEFVRAFNKNPGVTANREKALRDYLNLYINFKLKVQAAYDAGLDKDAGQLSEVQNFRRQLADNIINEQANVDKLVKQAFERSQKEIHLAQVFVEVASNADTAEAFKKIYQAYKELLAGKDFAAVAAEYSSDEETKQSKGDLGYITVFTLPYNLENIVYGLKVNGVSSPYKSKSGYHIFKNLGERKPLGSRRVAQILIALPPNGTPEEKNTAKQKADSVYSLLVKGASFDILAATVSNDLSSNNNRGELPEFTTGTYNADFEKVAFSLKNNGEISKPFETAYGYHIIKLLEAKPVSDNLNDAATLASLKDKVIKDNRMDIAKKDFIKGKLALIKYKPGVYKVKDLFEFTDSVLVDPNARGIKGINKNTVIFSFAKENIKASDWINFVRSYTSNRQIKSSNYEDILKEYVLAAADEYYRNHLEDYNKDFSRQVNEFKEANLLFGIMERNVWNKANADTLELQKHYNSHKSKYMWPASADAIVVTCNNRERAEDIGAKLKENLTAWRQIATSNGSDVTADSGRYELGQLAVVDRTNFTAGLLTVPVKNETDGTFSFNYIIKVYPDANQRSFEDARGLVISDYQQLLEERWISELRKKYPVHVNEAVFKTIK